jgi:hypothetical protein
MPTENAVATSPSGRSVDLSIPSRRPRLTVDELIKEVRSGRVCLIAEYRTTKFDEVRYVDKKTGKPEKFIKVEHHVEAAINSDQAEAFVVEERQPKDLDDLRNVHIGLVKGQTVVLRLATLRREQGRVIASVDGLNGVAVLA